MSKLSYHEGDWIAVPLPEGGYAVGILARVPRRGKKLLGYFVPPRLTAQPSIEDLERFRPADAVLITMFGDLGLVKEGWIVIGPSPNWNRSTWPMPLFVHRDAVSGRTTKRLYSDDGENRLIGEELCSSGQCDSLPSDGVLGAGALQRLLARRVKAE